MRMFNKMFFDNVLLNHDGLPHVVHLAVAHEILVTDLSPKMDLYLLAEFLGFIAGHGFGT